MFRTNSKRTLILVVTVIILLSLYVVAFFALSNVTIAVIRAHGNIDIVSPDDNSEIGIEIPNESGRTTVTEEMTDYCREKRDAFGTARLAPFSRSGIVIPEWLDDTRECDDFENAKECLLSDG